jgi:hypothetical protein
MTLLLIRMSYEGRQQSIPAGRRNAGSAESDRSWMQVKRGMIRRFESGISTAPDQAVRRAILSTRAKPPENGAFFPFSKSFSFFCNSALADLGNHC